MPLSPGTKLGPYEVLSPLGEGGMGEIYRGRDTRLNRTVAIKILPSHLSSDPIQKQRFEREAKSISALNHPNICTLHDIGNHEGLDYLVMECVEGETLALRLSKGPLPLDQLLKVGCQIAEALDTAHRSGIVHRDLKPGNIMLTQSGAKLLDFGLAKPASPLATLATLTATAPQHSPLTQEGTIVGTFQYMSPEQIEGKNLDARSDIFSLGTVLYEMLTGKRAFDGKSQLSVASAILEKEPAPVCSLKPLTPPSLDHAIRRCLAKDPEDRWQSARDLHLELKWISESGSQSFAPAVHAQSKPHSRSFVWATAALSLFSLASGFAVGYFSRPAKEKRVVRASILPPEKASFVESGTAWAALAVSPDGQSIVVGVQGDSGKAALYVRPLNSATGQILTGTEGASFPFWSPDSRSIGFFADSELKRVEASGGPVQVICAAPEARGGSWSQGGVIIFSPSINGAIFRVPASGGTPSPVTQFDASHNENSHRWPYFLPDGKHFLYLARTTALNSSSISVGTLDGSESHIVLNGIGNASYSPSGYLVYPSGNDILARKFELDKFTLSGDAITIAQDVPTNGNVQHSSYSISRNGMLAYLRSAGAGRSALKWVDRTGKLIRLIDQDSTFFAPSISPDGNKLVVSVAGEQNLSIADLWIYDLKTLGKTRFTFSSSGGTLRNRLPVWSPDGSRIAFSSFRDGHSQIFVKSTNGLGPETPVYPGEGQRYPMSWSSDGHYLIALEESAQSGFGKVMVIPMTGGEEKPFPIIPGVSGISLFSFPKISPNGKWLAYMSSETGRAEIYLTTFPKGEGKWQVSTNGAVMPLWSRDGREIFYLAPDDHLSCATVSSAGDSPVITNTRDLFWVPLVASSNWAYDISNDGQRFLVNTVINSAVAEPISLVENWDAALLK